MTREHQYLPISPVPMVSGEYISDNDIFISTGSKYNDISDVLSCKRRDSLVHFLRRLFIATEANDGELCFYLSGVNVDDTDSCGDEFVAHCFCEGLDSGFGSTVDCSASVGDSSCD